jgi:hypothetical protein
MYETTYNMCPRDISAYGSRDALVWDSMGQFGTYHLSLDRIPWILESRVIAQQKMIGCYRGAQKNLYIY